MRILGGCLLVLVCAYGSVDARADTTWGGSLALSSDYLVRGISRSNDHAALQLDLHVSTASGVIAGVFASNSQYDDEQPRDAELDAFIGYVWSGGTDWQGRVRATYYTYPWNREGTAYNYAELDVAVIYRDMLELAVVYSPDEDRFVPYRGLVSTASSAVEANFQHAVYRKLLGIAGVGYAHLGGPASGGYAYWSLGATYDFGPAAVSVNYVDTSGGAKSLYYNEDVPNHWVASIIYRF